MNRRQLLTSMTAGALATQAQSGKRRNVIFILSDDHRYDAMGFMKAQPWLETPQMDRPPPTINTRLPRSGSADCTK